MTLRERIAEKVADCRRHGMTADETAGVLLALIQPPAGGWFVEALRADKAEFELAGVMAERDALDELRANDWHVAVHNDYRLNGQRMTFWLFTHPTGRWIKGEGLTDAEAIAQARAAMSAGPA